MRRLFAPGTSRLAAVLALLPAAAPAQTKIAIGVIPGALRFDIERFDVAAGAAVELTFRNNGLMPHNLVVVRPGTIDAVVAASLALGADGPKRDYVPAESADVVAHTRVLQPKEQQVLTFAVGAAPAEWGYVCTFPGHGTIMRGTLRVVADAATVAAPERRDAGGGVRIENTLAATTVTPRPLGTERTPLVMRTFLPNPGLADDVLGRHTRAAAATGYDVQRGRDTATVVPPVPGLPAAIGVSFGPRLAFCFDTVECRLLYAWTGGFLDMTAYWGPDTGGNRRRFDYVPRLRGDVIWRAAGPHPLGITADAALRFTGYDLDASGVPTFRYAIGDGRKVAVRIAPTAGGDEPSFDWRVTVTTPAGPITEPVRLHWPANPTDSVTSAQSRRNGDALIARPDATGSVQLTVRGVVDRAAPAALAGALDRAFRIRTYADGRVNREEHAVFDPFVDGTRVFQDREYVFADVPVALRGADYCPTINDDRRTDRIAVWEVRVTTPARLLVLLDARVDVPTWFADGSAGALFAQTSDTVRTSGDWYYRVFAADVEPGVYRLGHQPGGSFYGIAVARRGKE